MTLEPNDKKDAHGARGPQFGYFARRPLDDRALAGGHPGRHGAIDLGFLINAGFNDESVSTGKAGYPGSHREFGCADGLRLRTGVAVVVPRLGNVVGGRGGGLR